MELYTESSNGTTSSAEMKGLDMVVRFLARHTLIVAGSEEGLTGLGVRRDGGADWPGVEQANGVDLDLEL